jgi:midasin
MTMTSTTVETFMEGRRASVGPFLLHLLGSTGCGKFACIMEAARQRGITCLRLNMSSRVAVNDLIGKITVEGRGTFTFEKRQFAVAFQKGCWLLMDEVNLAPDEVLQAIGTLC